MDDYIQQTNNNIAQDKKKLIIKISIIVLIVIIIVFGLLTIYKYYKNKQAGVTDTGSIFPTVTDVVNIITGKETGTTTTPILSENDNLIEIYKGPVGGYTILPDGDSIRLFDRDKGLIVDVNIKTNEQKIVTDQPILKIHDVTFVNENKIITRSLENGTIISTMYSFIPGDNGILSLDGTPTNLQDNILELAKSQNNKYLAFVIKDTSGANIDILNTEDNKLSRIITLPISEWIPFVTNEGEVYLTAKASRYADSGVYKIMNGNLDMVIKAKTGQTSIISPDTNKIVSFAVYDSSISPEIAIKKDNIFKSEDEDIGLYTIADKCAWNSLSTIIICASPNKVSAKIPDDWYLGQTAFADSIFKFDAISKKSDMLLNLESLKTSVDMVSLVIKENNLFFKNKSNEHLFAYRLDENLDFEKQYQETNTEAEQPAQ